VSGAHTRRDADPSTDASTGRSADLAPDSSSEPSSRSLVTGALAEFSGIMLAVIAMLEIFQGIAAIAEDSIFVTGQSYTYELDVTTWGWIHLVLGVLCLAVGIGIMAGSTVGYLAGIGVAGLVAVVNFAFVPYYPFWALLVIAFNVLVIWALCDQLGRDGVDDDAFSSALDSTALEDGRREGTG
jgi:hypothetical protein